MKWKIWRKKKEKKYNNKKPSNLFLDKELNWSIVLNMSISLITLLQNNLNFPNILISSKVNCFPFGVCSSLIFVSLYCSSYASLSFRHASNFRKSSVKCNTTCKLILIFSICLLIPFSINFDASFNLFHKIFFSNNYWLFDPDLDPIINILPETFFFHEAILIISLILISAVALRLLSYKLKE